MEHKSSEKTAPFSFGGTPFSFGGNPFSFGGNPFSLADIPFLITLLIDNSKIKLSK
jgi:hypothetical protein